MNSVKELWAVFWQACKETPAGMAAPFVAFWRAVTHNPVLCRTQPHGRRRTA